MKHLKTIALVLLFSILIGGAGFFFENMYKPLEKKIKTLEWNNLQVKNDLRNLSTKNQEISQKYEQLKAAMSTKKEIGVKHTTASGLNIRQDASMDLEPIGYFPYNSLATVINVSNALWYKVRIDLDSLVKKNEDNRYAYFYDKDGNRNCVINKNYLKEGKLVLGSEYYVGTSFLSEEWVDTGVTIPQNPSHPFVYGLTFFDNDIADIMQKAIWKDMQKELKDLGYDGVKVVPVTREKYKDDVLQGKFDAVETAPADFINGNKESKHMMAFAKTVNKLDNNSQSYAGIIIVNKSSQIRSFEDIKGKTIFTCKDYSESGYKYQKYYLNSFKNIDITKECKLVSDFTHQEVLLKVAKGEAEVGFCGDFTMTTDPLYRVKPFADKIGIPLENKQQLDNIRNKVFVMEFDEINKIPNNPHAIKAKLYQKKDFVDKLKNIVKKCYDENREDFGLTDAVSSEYDFLSDFE